MKILAPTIFQSFRTKKKLSNSRQVHWIIAFIIIIVLGYLFIMIEFLKMHNRKVMFYNLKTVNIEKKNFFSDKINANIFTNNSPVFIIYKDKTIMGATQNLVLPQPFNDVLILDNNNLLNDFKKKINSYKNVKFIFPAKTIGISFEKNKSYTQQIKIMSQLDAIVKFENRRVSGEEIVNPSIILLDIMHAP